MAGSGARIEACGWGFRHAGRADQVLADVDLSMAPGELVVVLGASGSGKSTLLRGIAGALDPLGQVGQLAVTGPDAAAGPDLGLVGQHPEGNIVMERVGDDVALALENRAVPRERIWPDVAAALSAVGLDVDLTAQTSRLSGGQQQLLGIASACVAGPGLILLDEPTANLDPAAARAVLAAVLAVRATTGATVLVVEHRVAPWLAHADGVVLVDDGAVTRVPPLDLAAVLADRPGLAARVWVDQANLPRLGPTAPPGEVLLAASGVAVHGRLADTDLAVRAGEVVALTGPPGAGKSTLLACVSGLATPSAGAVQLDAVGSDPWRWPAARVAATFGIVVQDPEHQIVAGTVLDELRHGLLARGLDPGAASVRAEEMLTRLGLAHLAAANPFTLSGGEQRRLGVACALVLEPRVLILDEPTFGQDPATWAELVRIIAEHRDGGGAVLMATHDPLVVAALAAREVRVGADRGTEPTAGPLQSGAGIGPVAAPARLRRLSPLALLGTAGLLSSAALISASVPLNLLLAGISLVAGLLGGMGPRRMVVLAAPAVLAAASVAVSNVLLAPTDPGAPAAWASAALPASRVLAVALPGLVAAIALDPVALCDSLVGRFSVPARPAYAGLAALRLLPILGDEWAVLAGASRSRGLTGSGPLARLRWFTSMCFRLLVAGLRRAARLSTTMDARGLRSGTPRTIARPLRSSRADAPALLIGVVAVVAALATRS